MTLGGHRLFAAIPALATAARRGVLPFARWRFAGCILLLFRCFEHYHFFSLTFSAVRVSLCWQTLRNGLGRDADDAACCARDDQPWFIRSLPA